MLWTPGNDFNFSVDNFGATLSNAAFGTAVASHATNANQKGDPVSLLAGASVTADVFGLAICFVNGSLNGAVRNFLADILIDPAGGTSWSTLIENLLSNGPNIGLGGYWYYFPLFLKAGTSIGCQQQCNAANISCRVGVKALGKPSRPELLKVGTKVASFGADPANSRGSAITIGTGSKGAYTSSLGVTSRDLWWWQVGYAANDSNTVFGVAWLDVAVNSTNRLLCAENIMLINDTGENSGKAAIGDSLPIRNVAAGQDVYVRGAALTAAPDGNTTVMAYGCGS